MVTDRTFHSRKIIGPAIYKFQIDEVVKGKKRIRSGQTITILVPGPGNVSHSVWLSAQRTYLLQLSSSVDAENYKGL